MERAGDTFMGKLAPYPIQHSVAETGHFAENGKVGPAKTVAMPVSSFGEQNVATVEETTASWKPSGWLNRTSVREAAAYGVSFAVHFVAIVVLSSLFLAAPLRESLTIAVSPPELFDEDPLPQEFHFSPQLHENIGTLGDTGLDAARPTAPVEAATSQVAYELEQPQTVGEMIALEFDRTVLEAPTIPENVVVKGAGSVGTTGAMGAIDRITHEILLSLDERPTLVVWLFDQSGSLKPQRESIAKRFDRVYDELVKIEMSGNEAFQHEESPLLTAIAEFGSTVNLLTPKPTDDLAEIKAAVRAVRDDAGGRENVFQSVGHLAEKFRHQRLARPRRNVMIVVFTDEAGDDIEALDDTVETCRKYEMPVYVIGVPAPFGRQVAYVKYVDPDPEYDQTPQKAPVHQGPESLLPERIMLLFGGQPEDEVQIDSGFGPYGLCRLATETGGLYFTVHPNRETGKRIEPWETAAMASHLSTFFDERIMRRYRPDYIPVRDYYQMVKSNAAYTALVEASQLSATTPMENVRLRFPRIDDAQFARELSEAQRTAAKLEPKTNALVSILRQGERERPKVTSPRWQAGFDLAIGRALAVNVRTEGYNTMLAAAKQGLKFKDPQNDTWVLRPSKKITVSSALANDAADAKMYLERVVSEHPDTPWALEAAKELKQPMGWEWREAFTDVAGRLARAEAARNQPRPPREEPEPPRKPRRDPPAL